MVKSTQKYIGIGKSQAQIYGTLRLPAEGNFDVLGQRKHGIPYPPKPIVSRHKFLRLLFLHYPFARVEAYLEGDDDFLAKIVMEPKYSSNLPS